MRSACGSPFRATFVPKANTNPFRLPRSLSRRFCRCSPIQSRNIRRNALFVCQARSIFDDEGRQFPGVYGTWEITRQDIIEVWTYRISLTAVSLAFATMAASYLFVEPSSHGPLPPTLENLLAGIGVGALGIALTQIHIYITEIKRALQLLWGAGAVGFIYLLFQSPGGVAEYVAQNPACVWVIGPLFASLVGVTFKEGLCYGKLEAFLLTGLVPALLLGHLSSWLPDTVQWILLFSALALLLVFSFGKYGQDIKDDIGDGSVFAFRKMLPQEQEAILQQFENDMK